MFGLKSNINDLHDLNEHLFSTIYEIIQSSEVYDDDIKFTNEHIDRFLVTFYLNKMFIEKKTIKIICLNFLSPLIIAIRSKYFYQQQADLLLRYL